MTTPSKASIDLVLNAVHQSPIPLTAKNIADMGIVNPQYVVNILTLLHRKGKVFRHVTSRANGNTRGAMPFAYYVDPSQMSATPQPRKDTKQPILHVVVGTHTLTASQARELYTQLKELFSN
jgi:hypothetical protein